jgi:hypothetical protein
VTIRFAHRRNSSVEKVGDLAGKSKEGRTGNKSAELRAEDRGESVEHRAWKLELKKVDS